VALQVTRLRSLSADTFTGEKRKPIAFYFVAICSLYFVFLLLFAIDGIRAQIKCASYCLPVSLDLWFVLEPSDLAAVLIQMLRLCRSLLETDAYARGDLSQALIDAFLR
jgi:hypothetical protein